MIAEPVVGDDEAKEQRIKALRKTLWIEKARIGHAGEREPSKLYKDTKAALDKELGVADASSEKASPHVAGSMFHRARTASEESSTSKRTASSETVVPEDLVKAP